jgi:hypothetical protein
MIGRNEQNSVNDSANAQTPPTNGVPAAPTGQGPAADRLPPPEADRPEQGSRSGVDRAEEMANQLAQRMAALASFATRNLVVLAHRAREAAQDFWSDVQDFRNGERP